MVEDDAVIREATQLTLERHGYDVTTAEDGLEAIESFEKIHPDAVMLDIMLPGLDGISVCRRIRETSTVPIVMVSARGDALDVVLGLEAGADDYVTKPFDTQVLVARLRAVMRRAVVDPERLTRRRARASSRSATSSSTGRRWRSGAAAAPYS